MSPYPYGPGPHGQPPPAQHPYGHPHAGAPPMPYGQAPYPPAPVAPAKKGLGAGAIVAIVLGALLLLGGIGGAIVYVVASDDAGGSSRAKGLSADADQSAALKAKAAALQAAVATGDSKKVEGPLLDFAMLPETARAWFTETFGPTTGPELYGSWERDVFKELPSLITPFRSANDHGETEIRITRFASAADVAACKTSFCDRRRKSHLKMLGSMKQHTALYVVRFAKPGSAQGDGEDELGYFAVVRGQLVYLGQLIGLWE